MKIVVLGRGLAGCFTAAHFKYFSAQCEVELIFDSKIPPVPIGQATTAENPKLLWTLFQPNWYKNPIKATFKTGILYENWGKKNDKFFHPFPFGGVALHYDTTSCQDYLCKNGNFKITDKNILDYNEVDADYIFDCRGFPSNYDDYDLLINPLNAALCAKSNEVKSTQHWTRVIATPNGWTWDIPLTDHTSLGYLYNSDITSDEDAEKNFNEMFESIKIYTKMKFKNYVSKNPIIDDRIILNGNRLFFLEPLESTSVDIYLNWIQKCFTWIIHKTVSAIEAQDYIKEYIKRTQNFILYHYGFGSKWNTPFWDYAKTLNITDPYFWSFLNYSMSTKTHWSNSEYDRRKYGSHGTFNFRNMYEGLN